MLGIVAPRAGDGAGGRGFSNGINVRPPANSLLMRALFSGDVSVLRDSSNCRRLSGETTIRVPANSCSTASRSLRDKSVLRDSSNCLFFSKVIVASRGSGRVVFSLDPGAPRAKAGPGGSSRGIIVEVFP